jgi:hypothetical protein
MLKSLGTVENGEPPSKKGFAAQWRDRSPDWQVPAEFDNSSSCYRSDLPWSVPGGSTRTVKGAARLAELPRYIFPQTHVRSKRTQRLLAIDLAETASKLITQ